MTQLDTNRALPRTATGRRSARGGPGLARLRTHLTVLEAERERHAKARFDTGGDIGDRAWRVEGETHLLALDSSIRRLRQSLDEVTDQATDVSRDRVGIGATVTLRFLADASADSTVERFVVGGLDTQDEDCPVLTPDSPLGRVLIGAGVGDTVAYASPRGKEQVVVLQIG
jgi:transcription elongation factor GreA